MTGATRKTVVHTCGLCEAIFEGANLPKMCPRCGAAAAWKQREVGSRPGVVGATEFVPGTETPMTRVFYCKVCRGLNVTRDGSIPVACSTCRHEAKEGHELFDESTSGKKIAVDDTPIAPPPQAPPMPRDLPAAQSGRPDPVPPLPQRTQFADTIPEEVVERTEAAAVPVDAGEYRSEWVMERVCAMLDAGVTGSSSPADVFDFVEGFYDEARKRAHLP
jgi:hypothetical protein